MIARSFIQQNPFEVWGDGKQGRDFVHIDDCLDCMFLAMDEITSVLRSYRKVPFNKKDNFALSTQEQFKDFIGNITKYIYLGAIVITSVGLMVGVSSRLTRIRVRCTTGSTPER